MVAAVEVSPNISFLRYAYFSSRPARGSGRGGFQQRDAGPPHTVLGTS